jgi:ornithine cyclodeaminase
MKAIINAIGSHTPDARELDTLSVRRSKVVVDSQEPALKETGDLVIQIAENAIVPEHV